MNSGLYALAGASATATAAACANRLDAPMTNVSKTYFSFSRAGSVAPRPCGARLAGVTDGPFAVGAGVGFGRHPPAVALGFGRGRGRWGGGLVVQRRVDGDGEPGVGAERRGQCGGELGADPGLEVVLGEGVADRDEQGAVQQPEGLGEADEGDLLVGRRRVVGEQVDGAIPEVADRVVR